MSIQATLPKNHTAHADSWIFEALMLLLDKKPYDKITVSDITNKAGIARRTFYRNYKKISDVLIHYLANIIDSEYISEKISGCDEREILVLTFNTGFMRKNYDNIRKILSATGGSILFLNNFNEIMATVIDRGMEKRSPKEQLIYRYKMYYQLTGICKIMWDWVENNMPIPVDALIEALECFTVDTKNQFANVPNVRIKIIDN